VEKVDTIREDLGSMGEIFDAAFERRFQRQESADRVIEALDAAIAETRGRTEILDEAARRVPSDEGREDHERVRAFARAIDLSAETLASTLSVALGAGASEPPLRGPDDRGRFELTPTLPRRFSMLVDEVLRLP